MKKIKILFIAPLHSIHSVRWIKYFINLGYDVYVLSFSENSQKLKGAKIKIIKPQRGSRSRIGYYFDYYMFLSRLTNNIKPDIIQIHWIDMFSYFLVAGKNYPVIVTAWGSDVLIQPEKSPLARLFLKRLCYQAKIITTDGNHVKTKLSKLGVAETKIRVIYFGTNLDDYKQLKRNNNLINELGFSKEKQLLVISIRALEPIYDVESLIRAVPLVVEKHPYVGFIIVGEGKLGNSLKLLSRELGIDNNVCFAGRLSDPELRRFLVSSDIYVSTSLSDAGLASSTSEAMASNLPVIVTDFGDNSKWVKELETGMLFPSSDYKTLARKIIFLAKNRELATKIAKNGFRLIEKENNYYREMKKVDNLYRGILGI